MKKCLWILAVVVALVTAATPAAAQCVTIPSGGILYQPGHYLAGQSIKPGADPYGYNYQAFQFNGSYFNVYAGGDGYPPYDGNDAAYVAVNPGVVPVYNQLGKMVSGHWAWPYRTTDLVMKWNDAWMSNKDCDGDDKLDRHLGFTSFIGSGAWETNHMSDSYTIPAKKGEKTCNWVDFYKIVAVPADATKSGHNWYTAAGVLIGPALWGEFAIVQEVYNDVCGGYNGLLAKSPASPGFGFYK